MIPVYINNIKSLVPINSTILQACEKLGIEIPKFCFHNHLEIAGNCRMCLVEVVNSPKPVVACTIPVIKDMRIFTDTPLVKRAREGVLEFLLLNHPLDCPICDQGGECDLQDQSFFFGSDKSRFFENKRVVEDKNFGPFVKTIMTRCIHCTRCVRFIDQVCGETSLGTIGRGSSTEISTYSQKKLMSEFSANVIDLCPVGALTAKPLAFQNRSWELKNFNNIDVLDSIGSNIKVNIFKNKVVRILPRVNEKINIDWIDNKTRFFFDSLNYQRIQEPLLKEGGNLKKISWEDSFKLLHNKINKIDSSCINYVVGDLIDLESLYLLKKKMNLIGKGSIQFQTALNNQPFINADLSSNFLFNNMSLSQLEDMDLCLLIDCNPRKEGSILNLRLRNLVKNNNLEIYNIGTKLELTYPVVNLGSSLNTFIEIIEGKHFLCKKISKLKKVSLIFGSSFFSNVSNEHLIHYFYKNYKGQKNVNILFNQAGLLNLMEINFKFDKFKQNSKKSLTFLYNTDNVFNSNSNFIVYIGHHLTEDAQKADLILPTVTYLEKNIISLNITGYIQKFKKSLTSIYNGKIDYLFFKNLMYFLIKNKKKINIFEDLPYLINKGIYINNKMSTVIYKNKLMISTIYKKPLILNNFNLNTILEKYSKILTKSYLILNKNSNF